MIRRCEGSEGYDEEAIIEWAKTLDTIMAGAMKGWRAQDGNEKKANLKQDAG